MEVQTMSELKTCPFCGGKPKRITRKFNTLGAYGDKDTERTWFAIACSDCRTGQPYRHYFAKASAETAWNSRADKE
jgi:Lar family restriction alleviation protein